MEDDRLFQYLKLVAENISIWQILALLMLCWLLFNREVIRQIPKYISRIKFGDLEVEIREIKEKLAETEQEVASLEVQLKYERQQLADILGSFDPHASIGELAEVRQSLKSIAGTFEDMTPVLEGLAPNAAPERVYAAAEILRSRRDPALFDSIVETLERWGRDPKLGGLRLYTVWTLTSALHRTLIADIKHSKSPTLSARQLSRAREALRVLCENPRVLADRPDAPMQGILGPAKWSMDWIERRLKELN